MARITNLSQIRRLRKLKKDKEYKLSDGQGLYIAVKLMEANFLDLTFLMQEKENLWVLGFIPKYH